MQEPIRITSWQTRRTRAVVRWYVSTHWRRSVDPGMPEFFWDSDRLGAFAIDPVSFLEGEEEAMFRVLITCVMFQQRRDTDVMAILRGIGAEDAAELTTSEALLRRADQCACEHAKSAEALRVSCDLYKNLETKKGACHVRPWEACFLKRHTELLGRWGFFGKVPVSLALTLRERAEGTLTSLYRQAVREASHEREAAIMLEDALCQAWRIHKKIANLFLSTVTNPDLFHDPPWGEGVDWRWYVAIDTNVDAFLKAIGYGGAGSYEARRRFLFALSERVPLDEYEPGLQRYNPRIVQQAMYLFMSRSNRRALVRDCAQGATPGVCQMCDAALRTICSLDAREKAS